MSKVHLSASNFSYYAFHPKSSELSAKDQKTALASTILMGVFTLGLGHLVCKIVYAVNKIEIDSSRLVTKIHEVARAKFDKNTWSNKFIAEHYPVTPQEREDAFHCRIPKTSRLNMEAIPKVKAALIKYFDGTPYDYVIVNHINRNQGSLLAPESAHPYVIKHQKEFFYNPKVLIITINRYVESNQQESFKSEKEFPDYYHSWVDPSIPKDATCAQYAMGPKEYADLPEIVSQSLIDFMNKNQDRFN